MKAYVDTRDWWIGWVPGTESPLRVPAAMHRDPVAEKEQAMSAFEAVYAISLVVAALGIGFILGWHMRKRSS